jgi:NAD(P)-dependent dehydrogenase (short-subunit alcohol dehydrogenase family)
LVVPTDVTDDRAVANMVDAVLDEFGGLDFACNNAAGAGHPPTPLADVAVEAFDSGLAVSLRGVFLAMKYELPAMLNNGGGAIVNMSSTAGLQGVGGLASYVAAKHGLEGITKVAALDYAAYNIRVNVIAPGPILTDNLRRAGEQAQRHCCVDRSAVKVATSRRSRPSSYRAAASSSKAMRTRSFGRRSLPNS